MAIDNYQAINPFVTNPSVNPFSTGGINGGAKVGGVENVQQATNLETAIASHDRELCPDISGTACGFRFDCRDGYTNQAWGLD